MHAEISGHITINPPYRAWPSCLFPHNEVKHFDSLAILVTIKVQASIEIPRAFAEWTMEKHAENSMQFTATWAFL